MGVFARRTNDWREDPNAIEKARQEFGKPAVFFDLTQSNPTEAGLDYPAQWLEALRNPAAMHYDPQSFGLPSTRDAIARYYLSRGYVVNPAHVVLTASSSESYGHLLRLLVNPHEKVLIPSPSYPLFPYLLDIHDAAYDTYQLLPAKNWAIDREDLLRRLDQTVKAIMVVHPNNPTGSYVNDDDRQWLVKVAKAEGLALIVDEVFIDYAHGKPHESFITVQDCLTFVLGGLSKTACLPQMKLGWMIPVGPKDLVEGALARLEIITDTYLSVNTPVQLAAPQWLNDVDMFQGTVKRRLQMNWEYVIGNCPSVVKMERPQAGWYVLVQLPATHDDEAFCLKLQGHGVGVYPGYYFDLTGNNYIVISLLTEPSILQHGWDKICQIV